MKTTPLIGAGLIAVALAGPAFAQDATWTGEGSFGAGVTTGNTDTSDFGLGLKLGRQAGPWTVSLEAVAEYAETDGAETKNRMFFAGQVDRDFTDRIYGFGRASYEQDEFSGFENRAFVGVGVGYRILLGEQTTWAVEAAPGVKLDEVRETVLPGPVITPAYSDTSFSVIGASRLAHDFNDNVKLTNDTTVTYAETSTQIENRLAVTAALGAALSARFSVDVRHDTDPPFGFEDTDTATRVSLVYAFGE
ncbi:MAG: putative salt-induced outer membrane protein [Brevundimonas sp.]|jgi:putative salt-induced outer membrane protein|uniref:DUF481 domain-containing protein n=1 Tax=Brevundimonas sp. TaxID=1871086 RepID=UPI0039E2C728